MTLTERLHRADTNHPGGFTVAVYAWLAACGTVGGTITGLAAYAATRKATP